MNTSETANDKSQNPQDNTSLNEYGQYILIAYRFGSRERHSYLVDICSGIDTASERAEHEVNERGGKYSVVVFAKRKMGDIQEIYEAKCPEIYSSPSPTGDRDCEELKKEVERLKGDKVYWQLEAQAKHNANEQLRKELLKANNSYDEQFDQITALQSQCTEKDQEIERLKYLVERAFWAHDIIEFKEEHGL